MDSAKKDSANPFFKAKYADLQSVTAAYRPSFTENGIAVIQSAENDDKGGITVETMLIHSSGQFVRSSLTMHPKKDGPQEIGSLITYARRYALAAMVGVAPEDDDGEAAMARSGGRTIQMPAPAPKPPVDLSKHIQKLKDCASWSAIVDAVMKIDAAHLAGTYTDEQHSTLMGEAALHGVDISEDAAEASIVVDWAEAQCESGRMAKESYEFVYDAARQKLVTQPEE